MSDHFTAPQAQSCASEKKAATIKAKADRHADEVLPVIDDICNNGGIHTFGGIAAALNERGVLTMRNAKWYPATVRSLLARSGRCL